MVGRTRRWVDQNLFPDAPAPPQLTRKRLAISTGVALALVVIQLARIWASNPLNSIWAEDGSSWLADAVHHGFLDSLTTPDNGYLQTSSRIVAQAVAALPATWFAPAMALVGAGIVSACVLVVWRASAGHIRNSYVRGALAAMVVLLPAAGVEMLGNVTNTIWYLSFVSFWLLLWRPTTFARAVGAASLLLLIALSTAGVIFMFPIWLLRGLTIRDRRDAVIVAAFPIGIAAQIWPLTHQTYNAFSPPTWNWDLLPAYAQRVIGGAFLGFRLTGDIWRHLGTSWEIALGAGFLVCIALALASGDMRSRVLIALAVTISLASFLVAGYERDVAANLLWPHGSPNDGIPRYVVIPTLLLLTAIFVALDAYLGPARRQRIPFLAQGIAAVVLIASVASFDISDTTVRGFPTWSGALDQARDHCVQTRTTTVDVAIDPAVLGFKMPLACSKLR